MQSDLRIFLAGLAFTSHLLAHSPTSGNVVVLHQTSATGSHTLAAALSQHGLATNQAVNELWPKSGKALGPASTQSEAPWGQPWEGVSVRLRADQTTWKSNQIPIVRVAVRNQGQRTNLAAVLTQGGGELEVDSVWYRWCGELRARSKTLSPGWQSDEFTVDLGTEWQTPSGSPLKLNPGNHTVRYVLKVAEAGNSGSPMRVRSNPVVIVVETITPTSGPPTKPAGRPRMKLE